MNTLNSNVCVNKLGQDSGFVHYLHLMANAGHFVQAATRKVRSV